MKVVLRGYGVGMTQAQKQNARSTAMQMTQTLGTSQVPAAPMGIQCQAGPNGILATWNYPQVNSDIQRWRVYSPNESTLVAEIKDRGTRQCFVTATGNNPVNVFVSSLNAGGVESSKASGQGTPGASTATMPTVPPEYNTINSGGADKSTDYQ